MGNFVAKTLNNALEMIYLRIQSLHYAVVIIESEWLNGKKSRLKLIFVQG